MEKPEILSLDEVAKRCGGYALHKTEDICKAQNDHTYQKCLEQHGVVIAEIFKVGDVLMEELYLGSPMEIIKELSDNWQSIKQKYGGK